MKLSLVVAEGVHQGKVIPITIPEFTIGRDPDCQLRPASQVISKKHCQLRLSQGKAIVKDFGSTNGTYVNGERVEGMLELHDGDLLKVGPLAFHVKIELPKVAAPATRTPTPVAKPAAAAAAAKASISKPTPPPKTAPKPEVAEEDHQDKIAAMLLSMGGDETTDDSPPQVPEGSTIMEMPALDNKGSPPKKEEAKKKEAPANTSSAAADILRQMMRRPRT